MASVTQLGYLGIGVSDLARWEHFATDVLGLEANGSGADGSMFLRMDEYHHRFILQPKGADDLAFRTIFDDEMVAEQVKLILIQSCLVRGRQSFAQLDVEHFEAQPAGSIPLRD